MSLSPILPGRLPGALLAQRLQGNIQRQQAELARLQDMAATNQRFFRPGEDPAGATQTIFFQRAIERNAQLLKNVATDRSLLTATETHFQPVADALVRARAIVAAGIDDSTTIPEKQALALEVQGLIKQFLQNANGTFRGRSLFGGTYTRGEPFETLGDGRIVYRGDDGSIDSYLSASFTLANNIDGQTAFGALSSPITSDLDRAITLDTRLGDLNGGAGVPLGSISITVDDGSNPAVTTTVDLTDAETVGDLKTRLEAAFSPGPPGLTVSVNPASGGFVLTPSGGTVSVSDVGGGSTAARLGIASAPAATIAGSDLNPALTLSTPLADLNGGAGVDLAGGLQITSGLQTAQIDLSSAVTVEDALNAIRAQSSAAGVEVAVGISDDGAGIAIASRVSGADFSIGENGGTTAADLGVRTFTAETSLADLNRGVGVPTGEPYTLDISRRDGTSVSIDLSAAATVQDVLDAINAVDPGVLVASLNALGNGITLLDDDGVSSGPLVVTANPLSEALGLAGSESGGDPSVPLVGSDPNPQEPPGVLNLLIRLEQALRAGDDPELNRLAPLIEAEVDRFGSVRADVGVRLQTLQEAETRLKDRDLRLQESLSGVFDADLAEVLTQVAYTQATLEATLKLSAQSMSLSLLNYL